MELRAYLDVLRRHFLVFLVTAALVLAAAVYLTYSATPQYQATAQLFLTTPGGKDQSALQNGQFAIQRVRSYAALDIPEVSRTVKQELDLDESAESIASSVTVTAATDAAVLNVTAINTSKDRAVEVAEAYANSFSDQVATLEAKETGAVLRLVGSPVASSGPVSPNKRLNLMAGAVLGVILGAAAAALADVSRPPGETPKPKRRRFRGRRRPKPDDATPA